MAKIVTDMCFMFAGADHWIKLKLVKIVRESCPKMGACVLVCVNVCIYLNMELS